MHKFFSMYLFLFITPYMFRAHSAHHQERQIVSIQTLVTVILCWWPRCVQVGRRLTEYTKDRQTDILSWTIYSTLPLSLPVSFKFPFIVFSSCFYLSKFVSCVKMSRSKISIAYLIAPMRSTSLVHLVFLNSFCLRMVEEDYRLRSCPLCSIYPSSCYFLPSATCVQILRVIAIQLETLTST
jgi:hypothetical protein